MKRNLYLLFIGLLLSAQAIGQGTDSPFKIYVIRYRFGPKSLAYFDKKDIEVTNFLAENAISQDNNPYKVDVAKVQKAVTRMFPNKDSGGKLLIDWEKRGVFKALRDYPVTDSKYKIAEAEWQKLIGLIRKMRPRVEIGIYGIPFRAWPSWTVEKYNPDKKYDSFLSLVDFLAPSLYLAFADEEVGRERNLQYIRDNLDVALDYGKRLQKPVYPFFWHRIHDYNKTYGYELMQIDVFAQYIKFISSYSYKGYKASGVYWWEAINKKHNLSKVNGVGGWAKGSVSDFDSYDALMVQYAAAVVKELKQ
ncbi:hypothetical protein [Pontibacter chitinilyticus]|uniref:hypothetical protein n=1 Tax=Pontibacter chitinilyticus TaxID=2674989 RepID=UPI00321BD415